MPGNDTIYTSGRGFFPAVWTATDVPADNTGKMEIAGFPTGLNEMPFPRRASIVSIVVALSEAVTAGQIVVRFTKDGVNTGDIVTVQDTAGIRRVVDFEPGVITFNRNHELGFRLSSSATLAPAGVIDVVVYVEVQDY
jgi:hypothetical protein